MLHAAGNGLGAGNGYVAKSADTTEQQNASPNTRGTKLPNAASDYAQIQAMILQQTAHSTATGLVDMLKPYQGKLALLLDQFGQKNVVALYDKIDSLAMDENYVYGNDYDEPIRNELLKYWTENYLLKCSRVATPFDYANWLQSYVEHGSQIKLASEKKFQDSMHYRPARFVTNELHVPTLYADESETLIVEKGVNVPEPPGGHSRIYWLESGASTAGAAVVIYKDVT